MTFDALHKIVLYATVAIGLLPMATSGEVPLPAVVLAYGALVASWFYDPPRQRIERRERYWTIGTLAAFAGLGLAAWVTERYLLLAILFALVMVVTRLFQSRSSRDVFQLYGLTFMAMIAGAVINPTLSFIFMFLIYVVLLVWGLVLLHLQRDIEGIQAEQEAVGERPTELLWKARGLVTGRFLAGSSVLALAIFLSSLMIFFFFPRLGMGFFFSQGRQGQSVSGFNDSIQLGHFGTIKGNMRVVMRVELPDEPPSGRRHLRMRGISFDHYDGRTWRKTDGLGDPRAMDQEKLGTWRVRDDTRVSRRLPGDRLRQDIYLEPMNVGGETRAVFGHPRVRRLSIDSPELNRLKRKGRIRFLQDQAGDVSTSVDGDIALRYTVDSYVPERDGELLRRADGPTPEVLEMRYLQLPDELDPSIPALARAVAGDAPTDYDKVVAVERHFHEGYEYTTEGGHDPDRPLDDFLLGRKSGHCEYFATGMVVMLRVLGIPARPANGFFGGSWNDFGEFYAVRQADAHAWVEAWFPEYGWVTFDPTPASEVLVPGSGGVVGTVQEWFDSLRLQWYKWVVEYDLEKQIAFFRSIGEAMGGVRDLFPKPEGNPKRPDSWRKGVKKWAESPTTWVLVLTPIVLLILWRLGVFGALWRWIRRRLARDAATPGGRVGAAYGRMLKLLTRQGIGRRGDETPRELAGRLRAAGYPAAEEVERLTTAYESVRYAERDLPGEILQELDTALRTIRKVK